MTNGENEMPQTANNLMNISEAMKQRTDSAARELGANYAAWTIAMMDPHAIKDLEWFIQALREAKDNNDTEAIRSHMESIREVLYPPSTELLEGALDLDAFEAKASSTSAGVAARKEVADALQGFFERYLKHKEVAGFSTQNEVAEAAGISLSTVQSIESGRVRPQYKTVQALASAFDVSVDELAGKMWTTREK